MARQLSFPRGHSLMVKFQPSKLAMRVRFPLPAIFTYENEAEKSPFGSESKNAKSDNEESVGVAVVPQLEST
jgi:hypothetical protein